MQVAVAWRILRAAHRLLRRSGKLSLDELVDYIALIVPKAPKPVIRSILLAAFPELNDGLGEKKP